MPRKVNDGIKNTRWMNGALKEICIPIFNICVLKKEQISIMLKISMLKLKFGLLYNYTKLEHYVLNFN